MARVNVEQTALTDPRFSILGKLIDRDRWSAIGRMSLVWNTCQERGTYSLTRETLNALFDDAEDFADAVIRSGLGKVVPEGVYIAGTRGRIEWLQKKRAAAKANGAR